MSYAKWLPFCICCNMLISDICIHQYQMNCTKWNIFLKTIMHIRDKLICPGQWGWNSIAYQTVPRWMPGEDLIDVKSTLFQVMACCLTATSHYLNQRSPRSMNPSGPWFNIKMTSYQYRKSHCGDKTILRPSYLHNGISYTGKITSLYWIRAQAAMH